MKKNILNIIMCIIVVICITGCTIDETEKLDSTNNNSTEVQEEVQEISDELKAIFGDEDGKKNYFLDNEKTIRKFVTDYNDIASKKVTKVEWEKNHQIATLKFDDLSGKINTGSGVGFLIEFQFSNGKSKLNDYKLLIKDIFKVIDNLYTDDSFEKAFNEALNNEYESIAINENNSITLHYNEEPVGYLQGDIYFIDISSKSYE